MTIEAISAEVTRLASSVEFWRVVRLVVVAGTVLLATGTMIAQWMELRRSRTLAAKQKELIALKDAQLRTELAEKDVRIADANRAAADANERAGNANERAALASKAAEELRAESLAMQRIMRPRRLYGNVEKTDTLNRFAGMKVVIFVIPADFESFAFANDIANLLTNAKWEPELRVSAREFDGVHVFSGVWSEDQQQTDPAWLAGEALAKCLTTNFAATETGPNIPILHSPEDILPRDTQSYARPAGTVAVTVGMRPVVDELLMLKYMKHVYETPKPRTQKP
jgi:hypothetical protein